MLRNPTHQMRRNVKRLPSNMTCPTECQVINQICASAGILSRFYYPKNLVKAVDYTKLNCQATNKCFEVRMDASLLPPYCTKDWSQTSKVRMYYYRGCKSFALRIGILQVNALLRQGSVVCTLSDWFLLRRICHLFSHQSTEGFASWEKTLGAITTTRFTDLL